MRAVQPMAEDRSPLPSVENFLPHTIGFRWCVFHGRQGMQIGKFT
ncbi:rCG55339 [Rattus norvegicus]|uniref:RCG55339 n=1 Tax=Rattus norvegicus TaxID=10116 RepID=A6KF13_RAT|nr:rCG55339 [Rattus norvegicus]